MALLFIEGFDSYATNADVQEPLRKWDAYNYDNQWVRTGGRRGGKCYEMQSGVAGTQAGWLQKRIPNSSVVFAGVALRVAAFNGSKMLFRFLDGTTSHGYFYVGTDGLVRLTDATTTVRGVSANPISLNRWYYFEIKFTPRNSSIAGDIVVKQDGVVVIDTPIGFDFQGTANDYTNSVQLGGLLDSGDRFYDDVYICNDTGSVNNTFMGDVQINAYLPDSDGSIGDFTPSIGVDHFAVVDGVYEIPTTTNDYLEATAPGERELLSMQPVGVMGEILGIQLSVLSGTAEAGARQIKNLIKSGATEVLGIAEPLYDSASYRNTVVEQNPNTSTAWTPATIDSAEFGVELQ